MLLLLALCLGIMALPVLLVETPPLFDYANHLARVHVLANWEGVPAFQENFTRDALLLPNVLSDLVLLALEPAMGIEAAGKVLLLLILGGIVTGGAALGWAIAGRLSPWPLLVAGLAYHEMFIWGFLNYELGLALLLWGLAAWVWLERRTRAGQLLSGVAFALLVFFAHLVAFGLFAVGIAILELCRAWRERQRGFGPVLGRLVVSALIFGPPLAIFLSRSPAGGLPMAFAWDMTLWGKLSPFTRVLSTGDTAADYATLAGLALLALLGIVTGRVRASGALLLAAGTYALLVIALPYTAMGSFFLDARIAIAVFLLLAVALVPRPDVAGGKVAVIASVGLLALLGARSALVLEDWRAQERSYDRVLESVAKLPEGAVVVPAFGRYFEMPGWISTRGLWPTHEHTAAYAAIRRDAAVTNIFARKGQNPLVYTPAVEELLPLGRNPITRVVTDKELGGFLEQTHAAARALAETGSDSKVFALLFDKGCDTVPDQPWAWVVECGPELTILEIAPEQPPAESVAHRQEAS
ncbi:hypothetical protein HHL28_02930 [Aerophototrophica crusticola]|uniref:Glycosyltransferase RgtA/B/C/D-like domain-containing protein n=1 Tax=Aerophototrophica crusticola TaxID=1709002 RepID=A0A858R4B8_9PROT|nr:hypothetical protein HHL28_02930 [Rhodospirillaceae bacterium B3]